jgi:hypothetical protein
MLKNTDYIGEKWFLTTVKDIKTKCRSPSSENRKHLNDKALKPIVDREIWDRVQEKLVKRTKPHVPEKHIMARKLYCGHCNKTLRRNKNFSCIKSSLTGGENCFKGTLKQADLYPAVLEKIKAFIGSELERLSTRLSFSDKKKLESEIASLIEKKAEILQNYTDGKITRDECMRRKSVVNERISELKHTVEKWRDTKAMRTKHDGKEQAIDTLKRLFEADELTKEHMKFVKRINAYSAENFEIIMENGDSLLILCRNVPLYDEV